MLTPDDVISTSTDVYSNVRLECDGNEVNCDGLKLAQLSKVFLDMFTCSPRKSASTGYFELKGDNYDILQQITSSVECGIVTIEPSNVMLLLTFADKYEISTLRSICAQFLLKAINSTVSMMLWKYGELFHAKQLAQDAKIYTVDNFSVTLDPLISLTRGFLESDAHMIIDLLSEPALNISYENKVLEALLDWVLYDADSRGSSLIAMCEKCVKLHRINAQFVLQK